MLYLVFKGPEHRQKVLLDHVQASTDDQLADKLIEEMAELTQALVKYKSKKDSQRFSNLELEFGDVLVQLVLLQEKLMLIPSCEGRIQRIESQLKRKDK